MMEVFLLTGGYSKRMTRPKSELLWRGKTFRDHLLASFPEAKTVGHNEGYEADFPDLYLRGSSLQGIVSSLTHSTGKRCLILSCDMPFLEKKHVASLLNARGTACFYKDRFLPFPAVYEKKYLEYYKRELKRNQFKLQYILEKTALSIIPFPCHPHAFFNINRKMEYNRFRRYL
ncbi:MAG: NTP transferase domain-containing protein [Tissierellia bacterium]|nr:NTP transferase domain-containing protein [Tissierellia bacterium]